jgi:hypothetical protein
MVTMAMPPLASDTITLSPFMLCVFERSARPTLNCPGVDHPAGKFFWPRQKRKAARGAAFDDRRIAVA